MLDAARGRVTVDLDRSPFDVPQHEAEFVVLTTNTKSTAWTFEACTPLCWWPHADVFRMRQQYVCMPSPPGGSIEVCGGPQFEGDGRGVLWIFNAVYPCPPKEQWKSDCRSRRIDNMKKGLDKFAELMQGGVRATTLAVPQFTGCTQSHDSSVPAHAADKGAKDAAARAADWAAIVGHLESFAARTGVHILVTKPLEACGDEAPYKRFPTRPVGPAEAKFRQEVLALQARAPILHGGWATQHAASAFRVSRKNSNSNSDTPAATDAATKELLAQNPMLLLLATPQIGLDRAQAIRADLRDTTSTAAGAPVKRERVEDDDQASQASCTSKRSRTSHSDGGGAAGVTQGAAPKVWTPTSWFKAHIEDVMTEEAIHNMRQLRQGSRAWLECEAKQACLTTSKFGACHAAMNGGSQKRLEEVGMQVIWRRHVPANKFMQWGTYHEDDGKGAFAAAAAFGLVDRVPDTPFSRDTAPFVQATNQELLTWSRAARCGEAPFDVEEVMDSRGVNVDVEEKVLAYSYDGLYRIRNAAVAEAATSLVLIEVKCTSTLLTAPREDHMCQMMGMVGGLRKQGYAIDRCVYVNWQRHATRFWSLSFDAAIYQQLLREMLWVWHNFLLPLFVARDNGILPVNRLEIPLEIDDIEDEFEV